MLCGSADWGLSVCESTCAFARAHKTHTTNTIHAQAHKARADDAVRGAAPVILRDPETGGAGESVRLSVVLCLGLCVQTDKG